MTKREIIKINTAPKEQQNSGNCSVKRHTFQRKWHKKYLEKSFSKEKKLEKTPQLYSTSLSFKIICNTQSILGAPSYVSHNNCKILVNRKD